MKILMLPSYCYPEQVSSSHLTDDLLNAFAREDITIEMHVPTPCRGIDSATRNKYRKMKSEYRFNGHVLIKRFSLFAEGKNTLIRALRYILCNMIQIRKGASSKNIDVVYSASTPPTQGLMCGCVKKILKRKYGKYVPFVYNLQDIFPDSLVNAQMCSEGSLVWKVGRRIENYTYREADLIITISEDFKRNIMQKGVPEHKIAVIPNWINTENVYSIDRKNNIIFNRYQLDRTLFYICYSGNIGHSQNLYLLLKVAKKAQVELPDVRFVLVGDGVAKEEIESVARKEHINNLIMIPFQSYEIISHVFSLGDVGLVISKPGIGRSSVPSKTWGIMAAQRPIIASFDKESSLARLIDQANCGISVDSDDENGLFEAITTLRNDKVLRNVMGMNGKKYLADYLDKDQCTLNYINVIKQTVKHNQC